MKRFSIRLMAAGTICACLGGGAAAQAAPALDGTSSAELQQLLAAQVNKHAVRFSDRALPRAARDTFDRLLLWNEVALDTSAIDHTPLQPGETRVFGENFGPHRASRAMAIAHIAMFEAVNATQPKYESYVGLKPVDGDISVDAAIAVAAHDALVFAYPSQAPRLDALLATDLERIRDGKPAIRAGRRLGAAAAAAIAARRRNDGSELPEPVVGKDFTPRGTLGSWAVDPVTQLDVALGANWPKVKPFVLLSGDQFRPPPPPALDSAAYATAYAAVKRLGGDPLNGTATDRTSTETLHGLFWTYDGTPGLCAPPRLYNQVARTIALTTGPGKLIDMARFLALINTAMADAGIAAWDAKWHYQFWRPVTGIRAGDADGNAATTADPSWYPLGGAATNTHGPNFTPPFPAYPSGHATFGGAVFQIMRQFYPDRTPFVFTSDEFNGQNRDIYGNLMPLRPLRFPSLRAAEYDNAESRIWIGVHWQFDADVGVHLGNQVADYVFAHAFRREK